MIQALQALGYIALLAILWLGGNWFTEFAFFLSRGRRTPKQRKEGEDEAQSEAIARSGRVIGLLERVLIVIGIVAKSWEIIAAVVALKSVARYKELDQRITAEYFLIGSLASILWAVLIAGLLVWYDAALGFGWFPAIATALHRS